MRNERHSFPSQWYYHITLPFSTQMTACLLLTTLLRNDILLGINRSSVKRPSSSTVPGRRSRSIGSKLQDSSKDTIRILCIWCWIPFVGNSAEAPGDESDDLLENACASGIKSGFIMAVRKKRRKEGGRRTNNWGTVYSIFIFLMHDARSCTSRDKFLAVFLFVCATIFILCCLWAICITYSKQALPLAQWSVIDLTDDRMMLWNINLSSEASLSIKGTLRFAWKWYKNVLRGSYSIELSCAWTCIDDGTTQEKTERSICFWLRVSYCAYHHESRGHFQGFGCTHCWLSNFLWNTVELLLFIKCAFACSESSIADHLKKERRDGVYIAC